MYKPKSKRYKSEISQEIQKSETNGYNVGMGQEDTGQWGQNSRTDKEKWKWQGLKYTWGDGYYNVWGGWENRYNGGNEK